MIEHGINGPFVRSAHNATATPQTEVVHAYRVEYAGGEVEYWNAQDKPFTAERLAEMRESAYGWMRQGRKFLNASPVQRSVTITATERVNENPTP